MTFLNKTIELSDGDVDINKIPILCRIMPMSDKERNIIGMGNFTSGLKTGYFYPKYEHDGSDYVVEENDIIEDSNSVKYRVTKILHEQHLGDEAIYIKGALQRI